MTRECTCSEDRNGYTLNGHADDCPWHEEPTRPWWDDAEDPDDGSLEWMVRHLPEQRR